MYSGICPLYSIVIDRVIGEQCPLIFTNFFNSSSEIKVQTKTCHDKDKIPWITYYLEYHALQFVNFISFNESWRNLSVGRNEDVGEGAVLWCAVLRCAVLSRCGVMMWSGMVMVWSGIGVVWTEVLWCGVVGCGVMWCGWRCCVSIFLLSIFAKIKCSGNVHTAKKLCSFLYACIVARGQLHEISSDAI